MDEAFLNDLLECSVCLEQLDSSSKVLPCQHTFCKRCLEEIVHSHKELRCPECRILVESKVDELPGNILLIRLLEGIKNNPRLNKGSCSSNGEHGGRKLNSPSQAHVPSSLSQSQLSPSPLQSTVGIGDGRTLPKQAVQPLPCAKAIYSYDAKEPGDLSFKKGDLIILRRRVDQNWYHGEVNSKHGFLPASYIQVMIPLPTHMPQCKTLYDFHLSNTDEKDCLAFSKGEVITVIRRVDENWAEGKLGEKIGIFPLSFVEMNAAARALMKLSSNALAGPSRVAPPTPTCDVSQSTTPPTTTSVNNLPSPPKGPDSLSSTNTTPSPASSSPDPSTPGSSSSTSPPTIPVCAPAAVPSAFQNNLFPHAVSTQRNIHHREKRHSLSALTIAQRSPQALGPHRHSMEILNNCNDADGVINSDIPILVSTPSSVITTDIDSGQTCAPSVVGQTICNQPWTEVPGSRVVRRHSSRRERDGSTSSAIQHVTTEPPPVASSSPTPTPTGSISTHVPVPTFYAALYNYKPQKEDELELKKGELYTVSEKCQDGWFKGTSLRTGRSGVFPGNYVQVAKSSILQAQFHQVSPATANMRSTAPKTVGIPQPVVSTLCRPRPQDSGNSSPSQDVMQISYQSESSAAIPGGFGLSSGIPVPQSCSSPSPVSYIRPKANPIHDTRTSVAVGLLEWARNVATIAPPPQRPPRPQPPMTAKQHVSSPATQVRSPPLLSWSVGWGPSLSPRNAMPDVPPRTVIAQGPSVVATSFPSPGVSGRPSQPMISLPASDSGSASQSWPGPTHSRGTAPLLPQAVLSTASAITPPNVSVTAQTSNGQKDRKEKEKVSLMKRLTSKRKSKSPPPANYSCDNPSFVDTPPPGIQTALPVVHVRSGSCPSEALGGQMVNHKKTSSLDGSMTDTSKSSSRPKQPAPLVRERFRCIVPYPPNSEYELELKVGDIVYVHKKREDGWYKGTLQRTGKTGLFPASFVEGF